MENKKTVYKLYKVGKHGGISYIGRYNSRNAAREIADNGGISYFVIEKVTTDKQGNDESTALV